MARRRVLTQKGFSLVEVLIVIAISLVLLAMAVPAIRATDNVASDVRRFVADVTRARSWARTTWRTTTVEVDTSSNRWRVQDSTGEVLLNSESDSYGWTSLSEGVQFSVNGLVEIDFIFNADGRCPNASSTLMSSGNSTWIVSCAPLSGSVTAEPVE